MSIFIVINLLIGLCAGIISGLGIGGGTILIPALSIFFHTKQQIAQTFNLIYFIPTAICAVAIHIKNKNIDKKIFWQVIWTAIIASISGAYLTTMFKSHILKKIFGYFLMPLGLKEIFSSHNRNNRK